MTIHEFFDRWRDDAYEGDLEAIGGAIEKLALDLQLLIPNDQYDKVLARIESYLGLVTWYTVRDVFIRHVQVCDTDSGRNYALQQLEQWEAENPKPALPGFINERIRKVG